MSEKPISPLRRPHDRRHDGAQLRLEDTRTISARSGHAAGPRAGYGRA